MDGEEQDAAWGQGKIYSQIHYGRATAHWGRPDQLKKKTKKDTDAT